MTKDKNILIRNIYYMLAYAFRDFKYGMDEDIAGEQFEGTHELFAEILIRGVSYLLKQGLFKTYESNESALSTIRGKIHIYKTYEIGQTNPHQAYCIYDELTENNIYNQVLKITLLHLLQCVNVSPQRKDSISSLLMYFHDVDTISFQSVRWTILCFDRRNINYQMLIYICEFIQRDMLMTTEDGAYRMRQLSEKQMNLLFQRFVLAYFQRHHPETNARSEQISWSFEEDNNNNDDLLPNMQTDIMLSLNGRTLIIDTKYYSHILQSHYNKKIFHSQNFMQLFTYVGNYDYAHTGKVDGMLLYAKTEEDISPEITKKTPDGNRILVRTLDLYQDFQGICNQLENCVKSSDLFAPILKI